MAIRFYENGRWSEIDDPTENATESGDYTEGMNQTGYYLSANLSDGSDVPGAQVEVYVGHGQQPRYILCVEVGGTGEHVAAASSVDAMELLARWAPAATATHAV